LLTWDIVIHDCKLKSIYVNDSFSDTHTHTVALLKQEEVEEVKRVIGNEEKNCFLWQQQRRQYRRVRIETSI
jgi:hypothetical protein